MDHAINLDTLPPFSIYLGNSDTPIRAYMIVHIDVDVDHPFPDDDTLLQYLQNNLPLHYPYTWLLCEHQDAAIANSDDVESYIGQLQTTSSSSTHGVSVRYINRHTNEASSLQEAINESFELAASHVSCSGLTKKLISENLRVTKYCQQQEESEICVVCQVEFETNERVAVLQCKHQYHPECITQWLLRKDVCPICKGQVLAV